MAEIQVTMDNVRNVQVEFDKDRNTLWLHFHDGADMMIAVISAELWAKLFKEAARAASSEWVVDTTVAAIDMNRVGR